MIRALSLSCILLSTASISVADVEEWGGRSPGTDYEVIDNVNVLIKANGTFKFHAEDPNGNLDVIGSITVADGVTGTIVLFIERATDANEPGATNVGSIGLTNTSGVTGNLRKLLITGDLGTAAASTVRNITAVVDVPGEISNNLTVTRDLAGDVDATSVSADIVISRNLNSLVTLDVGAMTGDITVGSLFQGDIVAASLDGDIALEGTLPNSFGGAITINSSYAGTISTARGAGGGITIGDAAGEGLTGAIILSGPGADDGLQGTIPPHSCERTAV